MNPSGSILCFGEIVWDALPDGIFLGGAPLNVACHLNRLGSKAFPVSRIGKDFLGEETLRRLKSSSVPADLVQCDPDHRTGAVLVSINEHGDASYSILEPASWDFIQPDAALKEAAGQASALVYGTLSTRSEENATVLNDLITTIPFSLCDVNLRKPYDDRENAIHWASQATVVKLNDEELDKLSPAGPQASLNEKAEAFSRLTSVNTIVVTRGGKGAFVLSNGESFSVPAPKVKVADTVGAGDAFTAAFLGNFLRTKSPEEALCDAIKLGAFVAGKRGAQPVYDPVELGGCRLRLSG